MRCSTKDNAVSLRAPDTMSNTPITDNRHMSQEIAHNHKQGTPRVDIKDMQRVQDTAARFAAVCIKVSMHETVPDALRTLLTDTAREFLVHDEVHAVLRTTLRAQRIARSLVHSGILATESGDVFIAALSEWATALEAQQHISEHVVVQPYEWHDGVDALAALLHPIENAPDTPYAHTSRAVRGTPTEHMSDTAAQNGAQASASSRGNTITDTPARATPKKNRRAQILSILQEKDEVTVKDIAAVITDCSEKTLQRELVALTQQGVLKKYGERRWSRYTLG
jgi:DNA-binding transcriptional ArsR family regulator